MLYCLCLMDHAIAIQLDTLGICYRKVNGNGATLVRQVSRPTCPSGRLDAPRCVRTCEGKQCLPSLPSPCQFSLLTTRYRSGSLACIILRHLMIAFWMSGSSGSPDRFSLVPGQVSQAARQGHASSRRLEHSVLPLSLVLAKAVGFLLMP